jgi:hypothetical protein
LFGFVVTFEFILGWNDDAGEPCHPYEPFKCPGDGACISIQYLCDGAADCPDGYYTILIKISFTKNFIFLIQIDRYDEDLRLCTAG